MSVQNEIKAAKAAHTARMKRLREKERREQQRIDERMIGLLREQQPELASHLEAAARTALAGEARLRAERASAAAAERQAHTEPVSASSSHGDVDAHRYEREQQG